MFAMWFCNCTLGGCAGKLRISPVPTVSRVSLLVSPTYAGLGDFSSFTTRHCSPASSLSPATTAPCCFTAHFWLTSGAPTTVHQADTIISSYPSARNCNTSPFPINPTSSFGPRSPIWEHPSNSGQIRYPNG